MVAVRKEFLTSMMVVPVDETSLFTLPLELRQLIYQAVVASPLHGPELLQTCREIHLEAQKYLFERPISFRSQLALYNWIDQVPHEHLPRARVISLNIQDVDLRSLLNGSALISHPGDPPRLLTWDLYEAELDRLYHALRELPNVQKITIRALSGRQSFLYREFLQKFLRMLGSLYSGHLDLSLEGNLHHQDLAFLSTFKKLTAFSFDGFSASSPSQTAKILSSLEHLTSLSLISQGTMLTPESRTRSEFTTKRQSFTGDVFRTLNQLTCFSVTEIVPTLVPTLFFTPEFLASLHGHQTLKAMKICLSQNPDNETMAALESLLKEINLKFLDLDWPDLDPGIFHIYSLVPSCLQTLVVRAKTAADAFDIISSFAESRDAGDLHALRELVLVRSSQTYDVISPVVSDRKDSGTGGTESEYELVSSY